MAETEVRTEVAFSEQVDQDLLVMAVRPFPVKALAEIERRVPPHAIENVPELNTLEYLFLVESFEPELAIVDTPEEDAIKNSNTMRSLSNYIGEIVGNVLEEKGMDFRIYKKMRKLTSDACVFELEGPWERAERQPPEVGQLNYVDETTHSQDKHLAAW